ncbi:MAG: nucleotidyltransferase domain-containing protein [Candidatus Promineifilaceae bacterium]
MPTQLELSPEKIAVYRATALERQRQEKEKSKLRLEQAWLAAQKAAALLRKEFKASRVVVFGSLAREIDFNRWSDVDIAAWGIAPEDTFRAIGAVMDMETDIPVNLVDVNTAQPTLLAEIERECVEL